VRVAESTPSRVRFVSEQGDSSQQNGRIEERFAGDEADFVWHDTGIGVAFEKLHEERDGLKGEIAIVRGSRKDLVYFSSYNLTSGETRERLARSLDKKTGLQESLWQEYLTYACWEATQKFREGTPVINLRHHKPRPLKWLIDGVVPLGDTCVIYGDGSSTKSLNGMALGVGAVTGRRIASYKPVERAIAMLMVDYETHEDEQASRYLRIMAGLGLDPDDYPDLYYFQTFRTLTSEGARLRREVDLIRKDRDQPDGLVFVLIDSIAWAVGGEVEPDVVIPFFNTLRSLGSRTSRVVVSHVSKSDASRVKGAATPYGSVFVRNSARSAHEFVATPGDSGDVGVGIFHRKTNNSAFAPDLFMRVRFDDTEGPDGLKGPITFSADSAVRNDPALAAKAGNAKQRLLAILARGRMSTARLAEESGLPLPSARTRLNELRAAGYVVAYQATDAKGSQSLDWEVSPLPANAQPTQASFDADDMARF